MSLYARCTPYLLVSTLPDRSTNQLPGPDNEDFLAEEVYHCGLTASEDFTSVYLSEWAGLGVALASPNEDVTDFVPLYVRVSNTGDSLAYAYWLNIDDTGATSAGAQYQVVMPGQTVCFFARYTEDLFNNPSAAPGSLGFDCMTNQSTTLDVTVLLLDIDSSLTTLGYTAA